MRQMTWQLSANDGGTDGLWLELFLTGQVPAHRITFAYKVANFAGVGAWDSAVVCPGDMISGEPGEKEAEGPVALLLLVQERVIACWLAEGCHESPRLYGSRPVAQASEQEEQAVLRKEFQVVDA